MFEESTLVGLACRIFSYSQQKKLLIPEIHKFIILNTLEKLF